jgi:hypothetical protein
LKARTGGLGTDAKRHQGAQWHQQTFSKVLEVKNDSLHKKPWKQGVFDSTSLRGGFSTRGGRSSWE